MELECRRGALTAIETGAVFAAILLYIWRLHAINSWLWIPILAAMVLTHVLRHESAAAAGFRLTGLEESATMVAPWLLLLIAVLLMTGLVFRTTQQLTAEHALANLSRYLGWGVFQQYLLNGYFTNRLRPILGERFAPAAAAVFFSLAHVPNPFLMLVTLAGGYVCARVFLRRRNLFVLGIAHGLAGFTLHLVIPPWLSHGFLVGPGYYRIS